MNIFQVRVFPPAFPPIAEAVKLHTTIECFICNTTHIHSDGDGQISTVICTGESDIERLIVTNGEWFAVDPRGNEHKVEYCVYATDILYFDNGIPFVQGGLAGVDIEIVTRDYRRFKATIREDCGTTFICDGDIDSVEYRSQKFFCVINGVEEEVMLKHSKKASAKGLGIIHN